MLRGACDRESCPSVARNRHVKRGELLFLGELLQRAAFPDRRVVRDVLANFRREDEESSVHPPVIAFRLFGERGNARLTVEVQRAKLAGGLGRG
jgi:hypothetical protein